MEPGPLCVCEDALIEGHFVDAIPFDAVIDALLPGLFHYCEARVQSLDLLRMGPPAECHPAFPKRVNAHWAQVLSPGEVKMRTWERGSGITLACGTGACAVCVAGVLSGRTDRKLLAHLPGGDLELEWREDDNRVYMTGPAAEVFTGEWHGPGE